MVCTVFYTPLFLEHRTTPGHSESPRRLSLALEELRRSGVCPSELCGFREPRRAREEEVLRVHSKEYVELVKSLCERGGGYLDGDTPVSEGTYEAAMHAAGAVLESCERAPSEPSFRAFLLVRPPGHHAGVDGVALTAPTRGFCVFNNVAIGAARLLDLGLERVLLLDHDCHHGNGTQEILYSEGRVLKIDLHQDPRTLYPGTGFVHEVGEERGEGYMVNVPLPPGSGDDAYEAVLGEVVLPLAEEFKPQLVLMSAGFDSHKDEPITGLSLSAHGFSRLYDVIIGLADRFCGGRLIATLEGGYGPYFPRLMALAVSKLSGTDYRVEDEETKTPKRILDDVKATLDLLKDVLSSYWRI
ncbi:MAG: histone deacetylase family protein [Candidatus Bathyarchaeia archaeon]